MQLTPRKRARRTIRLELSPGELEHVQDALLKYLQALPAFVAQAYGLELITMWLKVCRQIKARGGAYIPIRSLPPWAEPLIAEALLHLSERARRELPTTLRVIPGRAARAAGGGDDGEGHAAGPHQRGTPPGAGAHRGAVAGRGSPGP